jgi:hypothetical protein
MPARHHDPKIRTATALTIAAAAALLLLGSCAAVPPAPPVQAPLPARAPPTDPAPAATQQRPPLDWRDAALTPGTWRWGMEAGASTARFADDELVLRCDRAAGSVMLQRKTADTVIGAVPVTLLTSSGMRVLSGESGNGQPITLTFAARDPLLDAIAFSRGRFAVEAPGLSLLIAPSWPEISRVIEDCR